MSTLHALEIEKVTQWRCATGKAVIYELQVSRNSRGVDSSSTLAKQYPDDS
jgi:hypothetical protein